MYSIYADQTCIYSDISPSSKNKIIDPVLTLEDNSAGSLDFTIPKVNVGYDELQRLVSEIIVKRDGVEIWSGRILSEDFDFYNNKKIYCEGELAYFNDTIQPPAEYHDISPRRLLETMINIHNSQVTEKYRFTVGAVTVEDPNDSLYRYTNYESTLECLMDKFVNRLGGHMRVRKLNGVRYLDYLADYPKTATQQINFGKNLLDYAKNYSMDDFYTVIVPRGEQIQCADYSDSRGYKVGEYCIYNNYIYRCLTEIDENGEDWTASHWKQIQKHYNTLTPYLTIAEVNNGSIYLGNTELISKYGRIVGVRDWNDVKVASELLSKAQKEIAAINYDNIILDVTAVDLRLLNVNYEAFDILDNVRIISRPHGLDNLFPIRKMEIPMSKPEQTSFVLSHNTTTDGSLTGSTVKNIQSIGSDVDALNGTVAAMPSTILESARANATSLINMATNGYVTIIKNRNGTSELLITDEKDYTKAKKVWRWNINGLGYSSTGYNGNYGLAMTMDGAIVANFITTGVMSADRIRGGMLEVGGTGYAANGSIYIKDSSGRNMITMTKDGLILYDENGNGKAYMDHSGLTISQGVINGAIIRAGGSMQGAIEIYDSEGHRIGRWDETGLDVSYSAIFNTPTWRIDEHGSFYGHGTITAEENLEANGEVSVNGASIHGYTDIYSGCHIMGGLAVDGDKDRIIHTKDFGIVAQSAYETATPYFGDIGSGETDENGLCYIGIDDKFLATVNTEIEYQVFLQKYGPGDIWVKKRYPSYFVIEGTPNLKFGWEMKAIQYGFEGNRLNAPSDSMMEHIIKNKKEG